jgi:hypothetical protein
LIHQVKLYGYRHEIIKWEKRFLIIAK